MSDAPKVTVTGADKLSLALTETARMTPKMRSRIILRAMLLTQGGVRKRASGGDRRSDPSKWGSPGPMGTGTGDYKRKVTYTPNQPTDHGIVGTDRVDALIHEHGGKITAKRAKFLAIPLTPTARLAGRPRNMGGLFPFFPVPFRGFGFLATQAGKGRITPHFLLKRSVTLRRRPAWGPAWEFAAPMIRRAFEQGTANLITNKAVA